jgi:hypothetical protein
MGPLARRFHRGTVVVDPQAIVLAAFAPNANTVVLPGSKPLPVIVTSVAPACLARGTRVRSTTQFDLADRESDTHVCFVPSLIAVALVIPLTSAGTSP